jgi:hypothetical protein
MDSEMVETAKEMMLTAADASAVEKAHASVLETYLQPDSPRANIVGVASGIKWTGGEPTGKPAVLVLVTHKVDKAELAKEDQVPKTISAVPTDVLQVGYPVAGDGSLGAGTETLAARVRPASGGYSVGHFAITAGTIATGAYDILPGGSTSPPTHGVGIPPRYYILSNNHVLANVNAGVVGDPILQPGPFDGGTNPNDCIGSLSRFIPITLEPPVSRPLHRNLVDCALAEVNFHDLSREVYWSGYARGWRQRSGVAVGMVVKKTGRTTNFTTGRITAINATIDVGYPGGRVGRFLDQILTTNMSAGGDSGSLVMTLDNVVVGLLFAGSPLAMIANQIENVRSLLRVEVAEQQL